MINESWNPMAKRTEMTIICRHIYLACPLVLFMNINIA